MLVRRMTALAIIVVACCAGASRIALADTVDYGVLAEEAVAVIEGEPFDLIETLAVRIAEAVLAEQALASAVEVTVHKPQAPIPHDFADAAVTVHRTREDLA